MPIYGQALASLLKERAGQSWRPSNGFEGDFFEEIVCGRCAKSADCVVALNAMTFDLGEVGYPPEWIYSTEGQPCCTGFEDLARLDLCKETRE